MPLRPPGLVEPRPDNTQSIVGREGIPVRQDIDGTQIQRLGVAGADADWGPETEEIPADGEIKAATPDSVGGTQSSSGIVSSNDSDPCSVVYVWAADNDSIDTVADAESSDTAVVERPPAAQGDTRHVLADVTTKGDDCLIFIENDASNPNEVEYTINFH